MRPAARSRRSRRSTLANRSGMNPFETVETRERVLAEREEHVDAEVGRFTSSGSGALEAACVCRDR